MRSRARKFELPPLGRVSVGGLVALIVFGLMAAVWQSHSVGQDGVGQDDVLTEVTPWVGEAQGISRLNSTEKLENRFLLNEDTESSSFNCAALDDWVEGHKYQSGNPVQYQAHVWQANKNIRARPRFSKMGSKKPKDSKGWTYLGPCSEQESVELTGIVGLIDDQGTVYAYGHDHRFYEIDTHTDQITEIPLPDFAPLGEFHCAELPPWRANQTYQQKDRVQYLDHAWKARKKPSRAPELTAQDGTQNSPQNKRSNGWTDLGLCHTPNPFSGLVKTDDDVLWISRGREVLRLKEGIIDSYETDTAIDGIAWDETTQQLWIAEGSTLGRRNSLGNVLPPVSLSSTSVTAMGVEQRNGLLWVSTSAGVIAQYDANGIYFGDISLELGPIMHIVPASQGGMWVADDTTLLNLDENGTIRLTLQPDMASQRITSVTVTGDDSVWMASQHQLWRYSEAEGLQQKGSNPNLDRPTILNSPTINALSSQVNRNQSPQILSDPFGEVHLNQDYGYDVMATDPDGDSLVYRLLDYPEGMTLDETTGALLWVADRVGSFNVRVGVFDNRGGQASQSFVIDVLESEISTTLTDDSPPNDQGQASDSVEGVPQTIDESDEAPYYISNQVANEPDEPNGPNSNDAFTALAYIKASHPTINETFGNAVALSADGTTLAVGAVGTLRDIGAVYIFVQTDTGWTEQARLAGNPRLGRFGHAVALTADGHTLAVGAPGAFDKGAVLMYTRTDETWSTDIERTYIPAFNADIGDHFGFSVALSDDGSTLAVGAYGEAANYTGINQWFPNYWGENYGWESGAVYVYTFDEDYVATDPMDHGPVVIDPSEPTTFVHPPWSQQAYIKASTQQTLYPRFGYSVALNADGSTLAVGTPHDNFGYTGAMDASGVDIGRRYRPWPSMFSTKGESGAAYVFIRNEDTWSQQAYIKASDSDIVAEFGTALGLSDDGHTLVVGAPGAGYDRRDYPTYQSGPGAAYVYSRSETTWTEQSILTAASRDKVDAFGHAVAINGNGDTVVVGAPNESSANNDPSDNSASEAGAAYVYSLSDEGWTEQAYVKASDPDSGDNVGHAVALNGDGILLAVGALYEDSALVDDSTDNSAEDAGAVTLYQYTPPPDGSNLVAAFTATPDAARINEQITFDASSSTALGGIITNYAWDFGDGAMGSGITVSHSYTAERVYTVTLTVTDDDRATDQVSENVVVTADSNIPPTADFTITDSGWDTEDHYAYAEVYASASMDTDGTIISYEWDFGDNGVGYKDLIDPAGIFVFYEYLVPGSYDITLTVTDDQGATDQITRPVDIPIPTGSPTASFTATPMGGMAPVTVNFDASSSSDLNGIIFYYEWDFGDGGSAFGNDITGVTTSHEYTIPGMYTISLVVEDNDGLLGYAIQDIVVLPFADIPPIITTPSGTATQNPAEVQGTGEPGTTIHLFVDDEQVATTSIDGNGDFSAVVPLNYGDNVVYAKVDAGEMVTSPSNSITLHSTLVPSSEQGGVTIASTIVWPKRPDNTAYTITTGDISIQNSGELIIMPGVSVQLGNGNSIDAIGSIRSLGTQAAPIIFTSSEFTPARGDWGSLLLRSNTEKEIRNTIFEYGSNCLDMSYWGPSENFVFSGNIIRECSENGIDIGSDTITIDDNHILNNTLSGIRVYDGGSNPKLVNNTIENNENGIIAEGRLWFRSNSPYGNPSGIASPIISGNEIRNNESGIRLNYRTAPAISDNYIHDNQWGIYMWGGVGATQIADIEPPLPVINNNRFEDNFSLSGLINPRPLRRHLYADRYYRGTEHTVDAQNNWFGTTNPADIADQMSHACPDPVCWNKQGGKPFINYLGFLDGPDGQPISGNYIVNIQGSTVLQQGQKYIAIESPVIPSGETLIIEPGVILEFAERTPGFAVGSEDRRLLARGSLDAQGTQSQPILIKGASNAPDSWKGILSYSNVTMDNTIFAGAEQGIIQDNSSSFLNISSSLFKNNTWALEIRKSSNVALSSSVFVDNERGIVFTDEVPPTQISNNDIFNNALSGLSLQQNQDGLVVNPSLNIVNAQNNWWGNSPPNVLVAQTGSADISFELNSYVPWVDYGNHESSPNQVVYPDTFNIDSHKISPDDNGVLDEITIQGCFLTITNWVISIKDADGIIVRTWSGTSLCFNEIWDGTDSLGATVADGDYFMDIRDANGSLTDANQIAALTINTASPSVTPPADITLEASAVDTPVALGTASAVDSLGNILIPTANITGPYALGRHIVTWSVTDSFGNTGSATQQVIIQDTTPPTLQIPDDALVFFDVDLAVLLGAAQGNDIFLNSVTNDAPAIFPLGVTLVTWTATDTSGNQIQLVQSVEVSGIVVTITSPTTGSMTSQSSIVISGTLKSPENTGLVIDGETAFINRSVFPYEFSLEVALETGLNEFSINAQSLSGLSDSATIQITRSGTAAISPYSVSAETTTGFADFQVNFEIDGLDNGLVESIIYDWDGDGTDDHTYTLPDPAPRKLIQPYVYTTPESYNAKVTVKETDGDEFEHTLLIQVTDETVLDNLIQNIWSGFNQALLNADQSTAESYMTESMKDKYSSVITALLPEFPAIINSYTHFGALELSDGYTSYLLNRTVDGQDLAFFVYLVRGDDGIWRLISM